jgi:hypothetical protein
MDEPMSERDPIIADATCPKCGAKNDGASGILGAKRPKHGDLSICAYCQSFNEFARVGDGLELRVLSDSEFNALPSDIKHQLLKAKELLATTAR